MRDELCSKGGKVIKSIEIKEPANHEKKKEPEKTKEPEKPKVVVVEKPKEPEKPKVVVVEPEKPKPDGGKPQDKPKEAPKAKGPEPGAKPVPPTEPVKLPAANPVNGIPPAIPAMACYGGGAPWYNGFGVPPPPHEYIYSLLSQCYHLVGAFPSQKEMLKKGFELSASSGDGFVGRFMVLQLHFSACKCLGN